MSFCSHLHGLSEMHETFIKIIDKCHQSMPGTIKIEPIRRMEPGLSRQLLAVPERMMDQEPL